MRYALLTAITACFAHGSHGACPCSPFMMESADIPTFVTVRFLLLVAVDETRGLCFLMVPSVKSQEPLVTESILPSELLCRHSGHPLLFSARMDLLQRLEGSRGEEDVDVGGRGVTVCVQ
ncbi:hypothetical protein AOLI_G00325460 [Acnodon oligacanthus]